MTRQPSLPTPLLKAARSLVDQLAREHGRQAAAIVVHLGALVQHAASVGLVPDGLVLRDALDRLAVLHEGLKLLAAIEIPVATERAVTAFWAANELPASDETGEHIRWWSYPLADAYPALSVEAVKDRALCQTPSYVTRLLLELSYRRAAEDWARPRVIDPSCGAGHLLVESFMEVRSPQRVAPYTYAHASIAAALDQIHGVDLDPYAATIARYRLLVLAWAQLRHRGGANQLAELPIHVAVANSLLDETEPLLKRGQYEVVVANPPYITPKDAGDRQAIRERYPEVCHGKYSLALPFFQLMTELLVDGGWCAQLTANSFMKREFGKPFIEKYLPRLDLRWVIDTSGAYIPGHGTPTVILVHRNQSPTGDKVQAVLGIRGEPGKPDDPAKGLVWTAIDQQVRERESFDRLARRATSQ